MRSILTALQEGRLFELPEAGKQRALEFLARILDANPDIEVGTDAIEEITDRELKCNTGIGLGVAVPHIRARREEGELFCAIGWSAVGIDYGAPDNEQVHLVCMYYIPGAQKNVYLKEISSLVKAIKKTGGILPIQHASNLNDVRNLLLDWVSEALGDTGPEAVARMIKLEVRQSQSVPPAPPVLPSPVPSAGVRLPAAPPGQAPRAIVFAVLVGPGASTTVLAKDPDWLSSLEKEKNLAERLMNGGQFSLAGKQVFVTGSTTYAGMRTLYDCIAVSLGV